MPRTQLPHLLGRIAEIGSKHQVRIVNVAHAGDGNVHAIVLFDDARSRRGRPGLRRPAAKCSASASPAAAASPPSTASASRSWPLMDRLLRRPTWRPCGTCGGPSIRSGCSIPGKVLPERDWQRWREWTPKRTT